MKIPKTSTMVVALFAVFLIHIIWLFPYDSGSSNLYAYQADAFLRGQLDIAEKLEDVSIYNGKYLM